MAGETTITIVGNLTADPELRYTPSGAAVANFTVASTPRTFDKQANEFKDGETLFMRCSVWRDAAENVTEALHKGDRVIVTGRLVSRSWQTPEGENRSVMEMQVDEVGPSLRYATAQVTKAQRSQGQQGGGGWGGQQGGQQQQGGWGGQGQQGGNGGQQGDPWSGQQGGNGGQQRGGQQGGGQQGGGQQGGGQQQQGGWGGQQAPSYDDPPF